jgi:hypothetical protein
MRWASLLIAATGCARGFADPAPTAPGAAPVVESKAPVGVPGEGIVYKVSLRGIAVGRVQVAVGEPGFVDGRPAIIVRTRATSTGLAALIGDISYDLTTTLATDTGEALEETESWDVKFAGEHEHDSHHRTLASDGSLDRNVHAVVGQLRAWRSKLGESRDENLRLGDIHLSLALSDSGREFLASANLPSARYMGSAQEGRYPVTMWLSDDETRVPLKLVANSKLGEIAVEMASYDITHDAAPALGD